MSLSPLSFPVLQFVQRSSLIKNAQLTSLHLFFTLRRLQNRDGDSKLIHIIQLLRGISLHSCNASLQLASPQTPVLAFFFSEAFKRPTAGSLTSDPICHDI